MKPEVKKKKLIFHLTVCITVCTFMLLCFTLFPRENDSFYPICPLSDISASECVILDYDGYTLIGDKGSDGNGDIEITAFTQNAARGENAVLRFRGKASEVYYIRVYYSSGLSQSEVFNPVTADVSGEFGWSWKVPSNARPGEIRITLTSDSLRVDLKMNIC